MIFAYIDGDDIGLKIENSFMNNDEYKLQKINEEVKNIIAVITKYLVDVDSEIIFSGADGIICKAVELDSKGLLEHIRSLKTDLSFSIGVGKSLRDAFLALRYAKSNGKDIVAIYNDGFKLVK